MGRLPGAVGLLLLATGCAHLQPQARYALVNNVLVIGVDPVVAFGEPSATHHTSLIRRGGRQFLVYESFRTDKRGLLVVLLPGKRMGSALSLSRNLLAPDDHCGHHESVAVAQA